MQFNFAHEKWVIAHLTQYQNNWVRFIGLSLNETINILPQIHNLEFSKFDLRPSTTQIIFAPIVSFYTSFWIYIIHDDDVGGVGDGVRLAINSDVYSTPLTIINAPQNKEYMQHNLLRTALIFMS